MHILRLHVPQCFIFVVILTLTDCTDCFFLLRKCRNLTNVSQENECITGTVCFFYGGGEGGRLDVKVVIQESLSGKWVHCIIIILL